MPAGRLTIQHYIDEQEREQREAQEEMRQRVAKALAEALVPVVVAYAADQVRRHRRKRFSLSRFLDWVAIG